MIDFNVATDAALGVDIECLDDVGPRFQLVSGARNVAFAVRRRLMTPRGKLFYDLNYGFDLEQFCNAELSSTTLQEIRSGVEAEALKDPRVQQARCTVSWEPASETIRVELRGSTAVGQFKLVMSIDKVSVQTLQVE